MTLFSCCGINGSDDDRDTSNPRSRATVADRGTPDFRTVRYDQPRSRTPPYTDADAASTAATRSSQLSPRATPSGRNKPTKVMTTPTASQSAPQTPVKNHATTQDVSPSVYSQPSQPRTPPSASTVRYVGCQSEGVEAVSAANREQTNEEPSMEEIRKFMGDEGQQQGTQKPVHVSKLYYSEEKIMEISREMEDATSENSQTGATDWWTDI
ncbi:hypothetical protein E8E12_004423 [Didymella heteroderae]|uniref:Uncharacterized protein n=1 Tax=Didymella heteroderae TaxID=1769908 RepID=A0A9P4WJ95_9PLEO|nr:hypothetical protein E8E12_004423 [Didymella heteroderae]